MGRKKIPNAIRKNWYVPKDDVDEIEKQVIDSQNRAIAKSESEKIINSKKE